MVKMNMREDTTEQLKDENYLIERRYRPIICCNCSIPATHKLVTGLGCYPIITKVSFAICVLTRSKN